MGALRIEKKTSELENHSSAPASAPVSGFAVPPPPEQVVAALAEYETKTRDSFPSFNELGPASTNLFSTPKTNQARAADLEKRPSSARFRIAGVAVAAAIVFVALWALFLK